MNIAMSANSKIKSPPIDSAGFFWFNFLYTFFKVCSGACYPRIDASKPVFNLHGGVSSMVLPSFCAD